MQEGKGEKLKRWKGEARNGEEGGKSLPRVGGAVSCDRVSSAEVKRLMKRRQGGKEKGCKRETVNMGR